MRTENERDKRMNNSDIITNIEEEVLAKYRDSIPRKAFIVAIEKIEEALTADFEQYETLPQKALAMLCGMKDAGIERERTRTKAARDVIDTIAKKVGIDTENCGINLYVPYYTDGEGETVSDVGRKLDELLERSGDKVQLKRRIQELENENRILRSLIQK